MGAMRQQGVWAGFNLPQWRGKETAISQGHTIYGTLAGLSHECVYIETALYH